MKYVGRSVVLRGPNKVEKKTNDLMVKISTKSTSSSFHSITEKQINVFYVLLRVTNKKQKKSLVQLNIYLIPREPILTLTPNKWVNFEVTYGSFCVLLQCHLSKWWSSNAWQWTWFQCWLKLWVFRFHKKVYLC